MGVWTRRHNATTQGAAITLHIQTAYKSIEITRDKAMSPNLVMVASQAGSRTVPRKVLAKLKNILEQHGNKNIKSFRCRIRNAAKVRSQSSVLVMSPGGPLPVRKPVGR